jgi:menaquinone-9 beta-reductase
MDRRYDLAVVGAGPAGAATAYYAARAGLDVLLLDRQEFPRDKVCGDGLMPHAASEISMMGLADWLEEPHHGKFTGFSIYTATATLRHGVPATLHGPHGRGLPPANPRDGAPPLPGRRRHRTRGRRRRDGLR